MDKEQFSLQEYFYIGYIYLIILGIVSDALFYGVFRVSYLNYTTILDALISPISLLTNNWKTSIILIVFLGLAYLYFTKLMPKIYQKLRVKKWYAKIYDIEKWDKRYEEMVKKDGVIKLMATMFFLLFVSMRLGMGIGTKHKIETKELLPNYTLVFKDNSTLDVMKVGQNSMYFFYFIPGETEITVTPISDNLKQIKRLKKDEKVVL